MELTLRNVKGSKLTHTELDNNFLYLRQLVNSNLPPTQAIGSGNLAWQNLEIQPGRNPSITASPFLNLNLNTSASLWVDQAFISGINNDPRDIVDGSFGVLKNASNLPVLLKHNILSTDIPLNLSVNSDFVLKPNAMVSMVYSSSLRKFNVMCLDAVDGAILTPKSDYYLLTQEDLKSDFIHVKLNEVPSIQDHVMVFCNGILLNGEAIAIDGDAISIDRNVAENVFEPDMRITVNYKY